MNNFLTQEEKITVEELMKQKGSDVSFKFDNYKDIFQVLDENKNVLFEKIKNYDNRTSNHNR